MDEIDYKRKKIRFLHQYHCNFFRFDILYPLNLSITVEKQKPLKEYFSSLQFISKTFKISTRDDINSLLPKKTHNPEEFIEHLETSRPILCKNIQSSALSCALKKLEEEYSDIFFARYLCCRKSRKTRVQFKFFIEP
ncbi:hypothetical protein EDEG_00863 [Edhazardia aedis USNM 41457]|uniref:Uncharacterized protein n=1 Tax=Edhazardia aedis (strain USNM 41457) TaxID=1003232 RepID=J9DUZ1_EDHAE|nr:hypothetical protein EDEG_00863 [Edhazardia aedis USNM 41457]|eukprot:EJW05082.1 hypothetical protein EDEG_00863 [Edhazardia aedis USNM 41457]